MWGGQGADCPPPDTKNREGEKTSGKKGEREGKRGKGRREKSIERENQGKKRKRRKERRINIDRNMNFAQKYSPNCTNSV